MTGKERDKNDKKADEDEKPGGIWYPLSERWPP